MLSPNISLENKTVLITGAAGFIGSYLALELLGRFPAIKIVGVDSITDYYDVTLKEERLRKLDGFHNVTDIGEIPPAISVIENPDCLSLAQFVRKAEIGHVRPSGRTVHGKEPQACRRDIVQF